MERTIDLRTSALRVIVATAVALALLFALSGMASAQSDDDYEEQPSSTVTTAPAEDPSTTVADEPDTEADESTLPVTGSDVGGLAVMGGALVVAGGVLLVARKRRTD